MEIRKLEPDPQGIFEYLIHGVVPAVTGTTVYEQFADSDLESKYEKFGFQANAATSPAKIVVRVTVKKRGA